MRRDLAPVDRHSIVPAGRERERGGVLALLSGQSRRGLWEVPRHLRVLAVFGSVELDLREALIPGGEVEIEIQAYFGSVQVLLPPGVRVTLEGEALAGDYSLRSDPTVDLPPDAPHIRLTGGAHFASVECEARYAGEGKRAARRRIRSGTR